MNEIAVQDGVGTQCRRVHRASGEERVEQFAWLLKHNRSRLHPVWLNLQHGNHHSRWAYMRRQTVFGTGKLSLLTGVKGMLFLRLAASTDKARGVHVDVVTLRRTMEPLIEYAADLAIV